jgi:hypothetical protein
MFQGQMRLIWLMLMVEKRSLKTGEIKRGCSRIANIFQKSIGWYFFVFKFIIYGKFLENVTYVEKRVTESFIVLWSLMFHQVQC